MAPFWLFLSFLLTLTQAKKCRPSDLKVLHSQIKSVKPFCHYYLSRYRTRSPLREFTAKKLTELCKCQYPVVKVDPKKRRPLSNRSGKLDYTKCNKQYLRQVEAQFRQPSRFCTFYTVIDRAREPLLGAVPGLASVKAVQRACACLQPRRPHTTAKSTVRSRSTSPATRSKASSTTTFVTTGSSTSPPDGTSIPSPDATTVSSRTSSFDDLEETTSASRAIETTTGIVQSASTSTSESTLLSTQASTSVSTPTPTPGPLDVNATSVKYTDPITYRTFDTRFGDTVLPVSPDLMADFRPATKMEAIQACANYALLHGSFTFTLGYNTQNLTSRCNTYYASFSDPELISSTTTPASTLDLTTFSYYILTSVGPDAIGDSATPGSVSLVFPTQHYTLRFSGLGWSIGAQQFNQIVHTIPSIFTPSEAMQSCADFAGLDSKYHFMVTNTQTDWVCTTLNSLDSTYLVEDAGVGNVYTFQIDNTFAADQVANRYNLAADQVFTRRYQTLTAVPRIAADLGPLSLSDTSPDGAIASCLFGLEAGLLGNSLSFFLVYYDRSAVSWRCLGWQGPNAGSKVDITSAAQLSEVFRGGFDLSLGDSYVFLSN